MPTIEQAAVPASTASVLSRIGFVGRVFFALGLTGMGATHFVFGDFMTGRAPPWPEAWPGGAAWAYLTGAGLVAVGGAILARRGARESAVAAAALLLVWALIRNVPVVAADSFLGGAWTSGGKSLVFAGGLLAIAATFPPAARSRTGVLRRLLDAERPFTTIGSVTLAFFFVMTGVQHFLHTPFVASLIPAWFPGDPVRWTWFAGVALIAGGIGLRVPPVRRLAALLSGGMVFSWFWIVHLPLTLTSVSDGIAVFEALAVSGIAFVLAGSPARSTVAPGTPE